MGLSEREQQLLDDMERRLYQSEADVMQTSSSSARLNLRSLVLGIVVGLLGIGVLVAGVATQWSWLGLVGFGLMLGGVLLAFSKREEAGAVDAGGRPSKSGANNRESFSERMNKRWEERMDGER